MQHKKNIAMTLAEVLITLGIIGIVAALTISTLFNNYQKQEYSSKLKKFYTTFNEALTNLSSDYGCQGDLRCTGLFSPTSTHIDLGEAIVKYFQTSKVCSTAANCLTKLASDYYDGSGTRYSLDGGFYKFITSDGTAIRLENNRNNCSTQWWSNNKTGHMRQACATVVVDVNGFKPPNAFGRDLFQFYITNEKGPLLYPSGGIDDGRSANNWWKNTSGEIVKCHEADKRGAFCAGRVFEEGWQMNY